MLHAIFRHSVEDYYTSWANHQITAVQVEWWINNFSSGFKTDLQSGQSGQSG
jgi:hypothetical protein